MKYSTTNQRVLNSYLNRLEKFAVKQLGDRFMEDDVEFYGDEEDKELYIWHFVIDGKHYKYALNKLTKKVEVLV